VIIHLNLGSDIEPRLDLLRRAVRALAAEAGVRVRRVSPVYETPAVGIRAASGPFLNACVEIETDLDPRQILDRTEAIERSLGRPPETKGRKLPRAIDIDIVLAGGLVDPKGPPVLPHPGLGERIFFLRPLLDLLPDALDPVTGHPLRNRLSALSCQEILTILPWSQTP